MMVLRAAFAALLTLLTLTPLAQAAEEPAYELLEHHPVFDVRRYPAYVVAEVVVPGPAEEAGGQGFSILADYIFGKNRRRAGEAAAVGAGTTASASSPRASPAASERLPMTAPVNQYPVPAGFVLQFVMPAGTSVDSLPQPLDNRIHLRAVGAQRVAVIRYSGRWTAANYQEHLDLLRSAVAEAGLAVSGEPILARYDPPFMPFFWRRNEIWLALD